MDCIINFIWLYIALIEFFYDLGDAIKKIARFFIGNKQVKNKKPPNFSQEEMREIELRTKRNIADFEQEQEKRRQELNDLYLNWYDPDDEK